ncbi:MAG: hypothetical protein PVF13_04010 [Chromatiales bacterium]
MLKIDDAGYPLEAALELRETYPDEVLESEWNPVIAQLQLLKNRRRAQQQSDSSLQFARPEMELLDPQPNVSVRR